MSGAFTVLRISVDDSRSTWLTVSQLTVEQRAATIASVGDTITAEEAASLIGCTMAEVQAEVELLHRRSRS